MNEWLERGMKAGAQHHVTLMADISLTTFFETTPTLLDFSATADMLPNRYSRDRISAGVKPSKQFGAEFPAPTRAKRANCAKGDSS